jgi:hypothetical protein
MRHPPGQRLDILMKFPYSLGQGGFSIMTERVDTTADTMSVVTLKGHPLAGWRYWRVYSIAPGDVVIETGAYDGPGPGPKNYVGYYLASGTISKSWREFLRYIQSQKNDLGPTIRIQNHLSIDGIATWPASYLLDGIWDYYGQYKNYILDNVCQATACN